MNIASCHNQSPHQCKTLVGVPLTQHFRDIKESSPANAISKLKEVICSIHNETPLREAMVILDYLIDKLTMENQEKNLPIIELFRLSNYCLKIMDICNEIENGGFKKEDLNLFVYVTNKTLQHFQKIENIKILALGYDNHKPLFNELLEKLRMTVEPSPLLLSFRLTIESKRSISKCLHRR